MEKIQIGVVHGPGKNPNRCGGPLKKNPKRCGGPGKNPNSCGGTGNFNRVTNNRVIII